MELSNKQLGKLISEGKTKQVFEFTRNGTISMFDDLVYIKNKDDISAADNSRNHRIMDGKGRITVETSSAIFQFLNALGIETAFVSKVKDSDNSFVAKRCQMIPIEIVIRRIAFGTYLKLNPNVEKGFKFVAPELEIHIKDDANHDPLWSLEKLIERNFIINGLLIDRKCMEKVFKISKLVFEILERVWHSIDYQLVDLKVEFGVISDSELNKRLVLADIIDNETWRLWPNGDHNLMVDKQIYRLYKEGEVDIKELQYVKNVFQNVSDLTQKIFSLENTEFKYLEKTSVFILHNNQNDNNFIQQMTERLQSHYGIGIVKIFKLKEFESKELNEIIERINQNYCQVIVSIGIDNSIITSKTVVPVVECLDVNNNDVNNNSLSNDLCLRVAKIIANNNVFVWSKIRTEQCL